MNPPFPHCILGTRAYWMHSPLHSHSAPLRPCYLCPPLFLRYSLGCSMSVSSATRSFLTAIVGSHCGGGRLLAVGMQRQATGSSRSPRRVHHPETCGRPCSGVSRRVVNVHRPGCVAWSVGHARAVASDANGSSMPASWKRVPNSWLHEDDCF